MRNIAIIGCGNMGSAIVSAILKKGVQSAEHITIIERKPNHYTTEFSKQGCRILEHIDPFQGPFEVVILAVKPQFCFEALEEMKSKVTENTLIISIMAGISIEKIESYFQNSQVIRAMPNTPCSIFMGMTVYCGNPQVKTESFNVAHQIFSAFGSAILVERERMIDSATAISGSGPAYVFYLAEALESGAMQLGFNRQQAKILARQTLLGSSMLLEQSNESPEDLRKKVTSPGGTTEAAIKQYDSVGIKEELIKGYQAAFERAVELGESS